MCIYNLFIDLFLNFIRLALCYCRKVDIVKKLKKEALENTTYIVENQKPRAAPKSKTQFASNLHILNEMGLQVCAIYIFIYRHEKTCRLH